MLAKLTMKANDKTLNVVFQACISAMVGTLNLYLDPQFSYTWCEASVLVAKSDRQIAFYEGGRSCDPAHFLIHSTI